MTWGGDGTPCLPLCIFPSSMTFFWQLNGILGSEAFGFAVSVQHSRMQRMAKMFNGGGTNYEQNSLFHGSCGMKNTSLPNTSHSRAIWTHITETFGTFLKIYSVYPMYPTLFDFPSLMNSRIIFKRISAKPVTTHIIRTTVKRPISPFYGIADSLRIKLKAIYPGESGIFLNFEAFLHLKSRFFKTCAHFRWMN